MSNQWPHGLRLALLCIGSSVAASFLTLHLARPEVRQPAFKLESMSAYTAEFGNLSVRRTGIDSERRVTLGDGDWGDKWNESFGLGIRDDSDKLIAFFGLLTKGIPGFWMVGNEGKRFECYIADDQIWLNFKDKNGKIIDQILK